MFQVRYPSLRGVEKASKEQLGRWIRFLSSPGNPEDVEILNRVLKRFEEHGGWTPELSKQIGWP